MSESQGDRRTFSFNRMAADWLREAATLLERQNDNPFRVAAYRRAADAIASADKDAQELFETGGLEALKTIPAVGEHIAASLAEMATTGQWVYLRRLRGSAEPVDVFRTVPGVGPILASRLHDACHAETLEQLEAALHQEGHLSIKGVGPRRQAALRAVLSQMLARSQPVRTRLADEPEVAVLLDVDREYRLKAKSNQLKKITPRRFNPRGEAWLPVFHTDRGPWHFTALFSNSARAHEFDKAHDWVVIYFHSDKGHQSQRTVVTETRGHLAGQRVVRGREEEMSPPV